MLNSLLMAFSLYSRIPVPQTKWSDRSMRYCICFLPLVGAVIGLLQRAAYAGLIYCGTGEAMRGAVLTALPLLLSGGIHMDGFMDTCDAVHSYADRKKRLEILKDPHVGAFAVLGGLVYIVLDLGLWAEAGDREINLLCLTFVLSRGLSAFSAVTFPKAKQDGMLRQETDPASGITAAVSAAAALAAAAVMVFLDPAAGICAAAAAVLSLLYYRRMAVKNFGGITGDLSGWFTQTCELVTAAAVVLAGCIM